MSRASPVLRAADQAWSLATDAAARAKLVIAELRDIDQIRQAERIYQVIWSNGNADVPMPGELLTAFAHSGNYVAGAFSDSKMVGALAGFLGRTGDGLHLHSHILGVLPGLQGRSVGFALKQHQRAWSLVQGIETVAWTFDPLVGRNAYFNLTKLGADAKAYYPNFYGRMNDSINREDESDRLLVEWALASSKAVAAGAGERPDHPGIAAIEAGGGVILDHDSEGKPVTRAFDHQRLVACRVPEDIVDLRTRSPETARAWRMAVRRTLGAAMHRGYRVLGVTRSGYYILDAGA